MTISAGEAFREVSVCLDVTDLVEFLTRQESVSGVQRVIAEIAPLLLDTEPWVRTVMLDRGRGVFVELTDDESQALIRTGAGSANTSPDRVGLSQIAQATVSRIASGEALRLTKNTVMVYLGAVWINDALMMAARQLALHGAKSVYLLYDLTPVLGTGHTPAVQRLFERYLHLMLDTATAVPAISHSSLQDFQAFAVTHDRLPITGQVTGLPCGLRPGQFDVSRNPWPRPYALFVGTIEARKNHLLALNAWTQLIQTHGCAQVPDLVCIGRLGWNANAFLDQYVATGGLNGKISVLSTSVSDAELARFYAHAEFTVYPSLYEGWGLPVSESLALGKVVVAANNSSLPEAGGQLASYFTSDDLADFVRVLESDALDVTRRHHHEAVIAADFVDITWNDVAKAIHRDITHAVASEGRPAMYADLELGHEYVLSPAAGAPDAGYADQYLDHVQRSELSPMLRQRRLPDELAVVDTALIGDFGSPQVWGYELRPGRRAELRITRPTNGSLVALIQTRSMPGVAQVDIAGPGGPARVDVYLGSVITVPLGDGGVGEPAQATLTVLDASDSIEGFVGLRSFVILRADDLTGQNIALRAAADALRQELDFMTNTRSWKVTAPLRKHKGRGTS